jgi:phosphohistidine swiveling domain-containing protein
LQNYYSEAFLKDLSQLSEKELLTWSNEMIVLFKDKVSMPGFTDGFMFYADKRLDFLLREFCEKNNIPDYQKIYALLGAPIEPSFLSEEEEGLKFIAKKLIAKGYKDAMNLENFLIGQPDIKKEVYEHLAKYSWIKSSYVGYKEYTLYDFILEIEQIFAIPPEKEHDQMRQMRENKKIKQNLKKKYGFSEEILAITRLAEILVKWQDQRKHYTLMFAALRGKVLEGIAKRTNIDMELLRYCEGRELADLLSGKLSVDELKIRENGCLFVYHDGKTVEIIVGKEAIDFFENISKIDVGFIKEVTGMVASTGNVRGLVRVITSIASIDKVEVGEILVAPMTRPEHTPGMKKAAAIVTDDGGITCHAAIVARELKKPCIIGTKIATKVLRDGDLVEVDAERGIVKILKKADAK